MNRKIDNRIAKTLGFGLTALVLALGATQATAKVFENDPIGPTAKVFENDPVGPTAKVFENDPVGPTA